MIFKRILLLICLVICLFSMASVCASETNNTAMASTDIMELSQGDKILTDNLKTTENYSPLGQINNGGIISETRDNGTFMDLQIKINATKEGGTVNLMNNYTYNESDKEISITKAITINGNGFTINGLEKTRIFNITASGNIVLNNITFVNGKSDLGGAIIFNNDVSDIVISNCKFINSSATTNGGALYFKEKFIKSTISNTEFINNVAAKNGGAVYIFNSSSENLFENLTFANNNAKGADGGAINFHWELLKTRFHNVTFFKNSAKSCGGAINTDQNVNDENTYVNVNFINNTASKNGGAINGYGQSNRNTFDGCSFENNSASTDGGAIYYSRNMQYNVFENCSFTKNTVNTGNGGAIYTNMAFNNNRFNKNSFIRNSAAVNGGSLYVYDKFTSNSIENAEFTNNAASSNGGAAYIRGVSSENLFKNLIFSHNHAESADGGAINFHGQTSKTSFDNITFFKNSAGSCGGAVNTDNTVNNDNTYVNVNFINNTASKNGGAINGYGQSNRNTFDGCSFENNSAAINGGAIFYSKNAQSNVFENSEFINNAAASNGGAIYLSSVADDNLFENMTFANNRAEGADGGAINFHMETSLTRFSNVTFFKNSAKNGGGAINTDHNVNDDNTYVNVNFINNTASKNGGAINGYGQSNRNTFDGCSFENNSASTDGGAIYYKGVMESNVFENCSFITNAAGNNGGAIYGYRASNSNRFERILFANNLAVNNAGAIYSRGSTTLTLFKDTEFRSNSAREMDGGSISVLSNLQNTTFDNVTFSNNSAYGNGGAINVDDDAENNTFINVMFIDNAASQNGGAVSVVNAMNNMWDNTVFNRNSANVSGGAIHTFDKVENEIIKDSLFLSNSAGTGSAINFENVTGPVTITAAFINNTGDSAISINESNQNFTVRDSIFLNNPASNIQVNSGSVQLIDNWFGNNATNYNEKPDVGSPDIDNWLFLNATAEPSEVKIYEKSKITFKLYSYDGSTVSDYDASKMNIKLDLTPTLGQIDKNTSLIGEEIIYTAKKDGNASITAKFETASYTIGLTNSKTSTEINVTNSTIDLKVNEETAAGATLTPADAGNLTYTSSNSSVAIVENGKIKAIGEGNATVTVSFAGDEQYYAAENKTIGVTVTLNDASVIVENSTLNLKFDDAFDIVATTSPEGLVVNYTSNNETVVTVDSKGRIVAVGVGTAVITVSVGGDGAYVLNSTTVDILVKKELNITASTLSMSGDVALIITGFEAATGNVTVTIGENNYTSSIMMGMAFVSIPKLDKSTTAHIYYPGDDKYYDVSKTVDIIAKKDLNITISADPIYVGENATVIITGLENATGNVTVIANIDYYNIPITNGTATVILSGLNNTTTVYVLYMGDDNYNMGLGNANITVLPPKENLTLSARANPISIGENATLIITGLKDATGNVSVRAGNGIYFAPIADGKATVVIPDLIESVTADVSYAGDVRYNPANTTAKITVNKIGTQITANAVTTTYNTYKNLVITLKDAKGNSISGAKLSINLGKARTATTDKNGQIKVSTKGLAPKTYTAKITFAGDDKYAKSTKSVKVVVKKANSKLAAKKKTYKDTTKNKKFNVVLKDNKGKAIKKAKVTLKVKGKTYSKNTNSKGIAVFNLKLGKGVYTVAANFKGNKYYNKAKTVKSKVTVKVTFKTVSKGSKDKVTVKKIQKALKKNGFYKNRPIDGIYQTATEQAVKQFQKAKKLKVTGKVDYNTAKKLKIVK